MMDAVISLCASKDITHQQVAVEALIHAAGKAKRASFITTNGVTLLKDLYKKSENDRIRVRALVVRAALKASILILNRWRTEHFKIITAFYVGIMQTWISRRDGFQHEAVRRGVYAEARQTVQEVCEL